MQTERISAPSRPQTAGGLEAPEIVVLINMDYIYIATRLSCVCAFRVHYKYSVQTYPESVM